MGEVGCKVIFVVYDCVFVDGVFVVGLWYFGGVCLCEGVVLLYVVGEVFVMMIWVLGWIL